MGSNFRDLLNKLKCPICKAPIDLVYVRNYNYGCAIDHDHYIISMIGGPLSWIEKEKVNLYDKKHQYSIIKNYTYLGFSSLEIKVNETDLEGRVIFSFEEKVFKSDIDAFDFSNFNSEKAINRIKTLFAFQ
jgi:hypothetical protein